MMKVPISMRFYHNMPHVSFIGGNNVVMRGTEDEERKFVYCPDENIPFILDVTGITPPHAKYFISRNCCDHYILAYVTSGKGTMEYNGIHYDLRTGDTLLLEPGSKHVYYASPKDPFELIWANFFCDYMASYLSSIGLKGIPVIHDTNSGEALRAIVSLAFKDPNNDHLCFPVMKIVDDILLTLAEKTFWEKKQLPSSRLAHDIKDLLDENIFGSIDIAAIAETLHISKSTLFREFSKHYQTGPHQYLLQRKIEHAKMLLGRSDNSVKDIAGKLGFPDEFYFSNIFKRKTGMSPSAYRKSTMGNKYPPA